MRRNRLLREFRQILVARVEEVAALLVADHLAGITEAMVAGDLDPYEAADRLLAGMIRDRPPPSSEA
jgi:hypothetical protein